MDILFENRFYATRKMMTEFGRKYAVGPTVPRMILVWVLYVAVFVPALVSPESFSPLLRAVLYILGPVLLITAFLPALYARASIRHAKKQNDGIQPETVITFGDAIELREGMIHITVEYRKIIKVVHLKHSYMLMIGKRNGVMLDPDGFTKGSFSEFKQFLRVKRPDLNIPE